MEKEIKYAGFWVRAIADLIDSLLLDFVAVIVEFVGMGIYFWIGMLLEKGGTADLASFYESINPFRFQLIYAIIRVALSLVYYPWLTYRTGTTIGKRLLHVYVVSKNGFAPITFHQSMVRCLAYVLSYLPMGAGFLMVAFHPEKRALHDLIAGTVSIIRPKDVTPNEAQSPKEG